MLFDVGAGVPRNPDLARQWFDAAAEEIPAAGQRRASVERSPCATFEAPSPLSALLIEDEAGPRLALAWSAPPALEPTDFVVEVVTLDGADVGGALSRRATRSSAIEVDLPGPARTVAWRIRRDDPFGAGAASLVEAAERRG